MAIQINGNGTITGISSGGLPAGSITSATLADGAASGTKLTMPSGSVIQTVSTNYTGTSAVSVPNASLADTPATVTITSVAANSKFLISAGVNGEPSSSDHNYGFVLRRVIGGSGASLNVGGSAGSRSSISFMQSTGYWADDNSSTPSTSVLAPYLDSPSQAAGTAITYKIAIMGLGTSGTFYFGYTGGNSDNANNERTPNHITVQEIAA
jgi:hypothetical protein